MLGLALLGLMATVWSCEKDHSSSSENVAISIAEATDKLAVDVAELPAEITSYVGSSFAPFAIEEAWYVADAGYEIALEDGRLVYFGEDNTFLGRGPRHGARGCMHGDTLALDSLPAAIGEYVAANYPDATIQTAVSKRGGTVFAVELSDGTTLLFDAEGAYLRACGEGTGGPGHGPSDTLHQDSFPHGHGHSDSLHQDSTHQMSCTSGTAVELDSLPAAIGEYVASNYPDLTIASAVSKRNGAILAVELSDGVVLIFKADGTFVKVCGERPTTGTGDGGHDNDGGGHGQGGGHGPGNGGGHGGGHGGGRG